MRMVTEAGKAERLREDFKKPRHQARTVEGRR
jgi:hypothetical protein